MKTFAKALAGADSKEQATFLNEFTSALDYFCRNADFGVGMQIYDIAKWLDQSSVETLKNIVETWEYQLETKKKDQLRLSDVREELRRVEKDLEQKRKELEETT